MFNFISAKTLIILTILIALIIWISNIARADLDFFAHYFLSNKKYEKYITVRSAVVPEDEAMNFFDSVNLPLEQKKNRDLYDKKLFLIVQCKNIGDYIPFGKMCFKVQGRNFSIPIRCPMLPGNMENFDNLAIIYIGDGIVPKNDDRIKVTYYWENLYTM